MNRWIGCGAALCMAVWMAAGGGEARAADMAETAAIADRIAQAQHLTDAEKQALWARVADHLDNGGREQSLRETVRTAVDGGCRDECLDEAVRLVNRAMWLGYTPHDAFGMMGAALREAVAMEGPGTPAERMRAVMERQFRRGPRGGPR